jgi:hypothetical protein
MAKDFEEKIDKCLELESCLLDVARCEHVGDKTKLMLILHRFGSRKVLCEEIDYQRREVENTGRKLNWTLRNAKDILETMSIRCGTCGGTGKITKSKYLRERDSIQTVIVSDKCPACDGDGSVEIPSEISTYVTLFVEAVAQLAALSQTFMQFSGDAMNMIA